MKKLSSCIAILCAVILFFSVFAIYLTTWRPTPSIGMGGNPHQCILALMKDEVLVVEYLRNTEKGGKLFSIRKTNGQWQLSQTIDLNKIIRDQKPEKVVFNKRWMAVSGDYVPSRPLLPEGIFDIEISSGVECRGPFKTSLT